MNEMCLDMCALGMCGQIVFPPSLHSSRTELCHCVTTCPARWWGGSWHRRRARYVHSSHRKKRRTSLTVPSFLLSLHGCTAQQHSSGKPDGTTAPFVALVLLDVLLLWQESCSGRARDWIDVLGDEHIYCMKEQPEACRWRLEAMAVSVGCDWGPAVAGELPALMPSSVMEGGGPWHRLWPSGVKLGRLH